VNDSVTEPYQAIALIKFFSEEDHYNNFKKGMSFFRTPHYYRECEDKGRGDKNESCIGYWNSELGDQIPNIMVDGIPLDTSSVNSLLVYPSQEQDDSWLQSWCIVGPSNDFELSLSSMLEEFGTYFVVMPAQNVATYADLIRNVTGEEVHYGAVQYSDDPLKRSLLIKDSKLSYQKELRFYLGRCQKDEKRDRTVELPSINNLLMEAGSLRFGSPNGEVRYCSLGSGEVVQA